MKNKFTKTFVTGILVLFSAIMLLSAASAATLADWELTSNGASDSVASNVNAGQFSASSALTDFSFSSSGASASNWSLGSLDTDKYFQITISPDSGYNLTISSLRFDEMRSADGIGNYQIRYSKSSSFSSPTTISTESVPDDESDRAGDLTGLSIKVGSGETLYIRFYGYNAEADTGTWRINDNSLSIEGVVTSNPTTEDFCDYSDNGNLDVTIDDVKVTQGFGNDNEWLPMDEIEVKVNVENNGGDKIKNIVVNWGLYDEDTGDWIIDDEEKDFDLKKSDDQDVVITFQLDEISDLNSDDTYRFYVWATGDDEEFDGDSTCVLDSESIEIVMESDFVVVPMSEVDIPETVSCGSEVTITARVWNIGEEDQNDVSVTVKSTALKIDEEIEVGDVDALDSDEIQFTFTVPEGLQEKSYALEFTVYDEDGDVYQDDYDDDDAITLVPLKIESCGPLTPQVSVTATIQSGGAAGEDLVLKANVKNLGSKLLTYTVTASDYSSWAGVPKIEPSTVVLSVGGSQDVLITVPVSDAAVGAKTFKINLMSGTETALTQPVAVTITELKSGFTWPSFFHFEKGSWYLWVIAALNVVLILIIIIVAVSVAKK